MRENNRRVYSIVDLFRYASLRFTFIAGFSLFFGIQVIYYGIRSSIQVILALCPTSLD